MTDRFVKKSEIVTEERKVNEKLENPNQGQSQIAKLFPAPRNDSAVRNSLIWMQEQHTQRILEEQNRAIEYASVLEPDAKPPIKFKKDDEQEDFRLDEEAAMTVARIREAAVKKIIETRTNGKMPTGYQAAAQDAEIVNYITATADVSILNKMPEPKTLKRHVDFLSPPNTVVRRNVACFQNGQTLRLPILQYPRRVPTMLPVKTIMRPSNPSSSTVAVKTLSGLKQPKEELLPTAPTYIPSGTTMEKIFITRGPDGKIVTTRRVVIKRVPPPPQIQKVILAPPPGLTQRLQPGNGNRELTNQPNCCEMTQKLVKEEPIDVKEEPMEDTGSPYSTIQNGYTSSMQPRIPGLDQEPAKTKSIYEPAALQRSTSPSRIFLGAQEPMKDFPEEFLTKKFSRFTQKIVRNFNLASFGKRPAVNSTEDVSNIINKSAVLIEDVEEKEEKEKEEDEIDREEIQRMVDLKKARIQESIRQKQALAQKLILNEFKICEYMQSDEFKNFIKPPEDSSAFQKLVQAPAPLAAFPEYCESLSRSSPSLFKNLARIHHMQNNDVSKFLSKELDERIERKKRLVFGGPVQLTHGILAMKKKDRLKNLSSGIIAMLEVTWNGVTIKVPEFIQCSLCGDIMRLCMRKCNSRGVLREHPAYRCLRKHCQTFHSVKKQFNLNMKNKISHWYAIPVPPKVSSKKKKKGSYMGPTKFIIKAVEWTPKVENVEIFKSENPEKDIEISKEDSPENAEIARDEDEDAGETIGFSFFTENSNLESGEFSDEEEEDTDGDSSDKEDFSRPVTNYRYNTRSSTRVIDDN
ncbi:hypothetical protein CRE_29080 [Caenorhabditis remanei]|uniref:Uncharacterized protein n=1 Tax=Caenorhabditis remanei TaxID=31234 RepID=E3MWA4_CAERE|nr:hypothetical protein CRE_29080 [Caenorhabditis remanei]